MIYGSVCSGIEAASVAWEPLGWKASFLSDIEAFPRAALKHHYPDTALAGDFTKIQKDDYEPIRLLCGGTPCQSFSVAGLRKGISDDRGNLALEYIKLANRLSTQWVAWENVPGVFSSGGGDDFRCFLSGLAGWDIPIPNGGWKNTGFANAAPGSGNYGLAWRVLDAQFFGVPQRRWRVFVVGYLGDWRPAAAVLLERHSLQGSPAPSRQKGEGCPGYTSSSFGGYSEGVGTLRAKSGDLGGGSETVVVGPLTAGMHRGPRGTEGVDSGHIMPVAFPANAGGQSAVNAGIDISPTLRTSPMAVAFSQNHRDEVRLEGGDGQIVGPLSAGGGIPGQGYPAIAFKPSHYTRGKDGAPSDIVPPLSAEADKGDQEAVVLSGMAVRRLTPTECERLQGFPDGYTKIPYRNKPAEECPDGPRYKALGNSMAVPVMRWIGERIQMVDDIISGEEL